MGVEHGLKGGTTIVEGKVHTVGGQFRRLHRRGHLLSGRQQSATRVGGEIGQPDRVIARNEKGMSAGDRTDVEKSEKVLVGIDDPVQFRPRCRRRRSRSWLLTLRAGTGGARHDPVTQFTSRLNNGFRRAARAPGRGRKICLDLAVLVRVSWCPQYAPVLLARLLAGIPKGRCET